jgi:hypothetical protein
MRAIIEDSCNRGNARAAGRLDSVRREPMAGGEGVVSATFVFARAAAWRTELPKLCIVAPHDGRDDTIVV